MILLRTLNISLAKVCRLRWWIVSEFSKGIFWKAYEMLNESCFRLAEALSYAKYWFDYSRFYCDSSILGDSNQIGLLKWLS